MKQQYVPLEKRSKKEQRAHHAAQRKHWGGINSVTRKKESKKTYNRKKAERWLISSDGFFDSFLYLPKIIIFPPHFEQEENRHANGQHFCHGQCKPRAVQRRVPKPRQC